jgi:hypothetical protein
MLYYVLNGQCSLDISRHFLASSLSKTTFALRTVQIPPNLVNEGELSALLTRSRLTSVRTVTLVLCYGDLPVAVGRRHGLDT